MVCLLGGFIEKAWGSQGQETGASWTDNAVSAEKNSSARGSIPREAWIESWFHSPRKASELGLRAFDQSPVLDAQVAAGELPPVEERLPDDPIVVEPIDEIGIYGGTARLF